MAGGPQAALPVDIAAQMILAAKSDGLSMDEFVLELMLLGWSAREGMRNQRAAGMPDSQQVGAA
jgi:hypothetical protein